MEVRPYDPDRDREGLWRCKRSFELELGGADEEKRRAYEGKLTDEYRERYLSWVDRCVEDDPRCVTVAVPDDDATAGDEDPGREGSGVDLAGYSFVLPERLGMVWDAAVLNEIFVAAEYRGTGVGDDLMERALSVARDQDPPLERTVLDVDRENDRARAFYDRHGFDHWGEMVARDL
ncbi:GNAT family N-acetyltransferase [Halobacteriales archaeon QS_8_69_26]|nr:MAG: GNAT family N-acetyltransferase [Halobacteriales archaeon QS_8_69_26]